MPIVKDIRFILKDSKSTRPSPVYLKYACEDGVLKYSTGEKITKNDWDDVNQRPDNKKLYKALDKAITTLSSAATKYITKAEKAGKKVLSEDLYNHLRDEQGLPRKETVKQNPFFVQIRSLIDDAKAGRLSIYNGGDRNGNLYSQGTIIHWDLAYNKLFEFDSKLSWNITMEDYHRFIAWCNVKGFKPNYSGTIIKMWKVFMNLGLSKKWHNNIVHLDRKFKKITEKTHKIYLTEDEIQALINLPLEGMRKEIRDSFIINLNTGLRISDHKKLTIAKNYKNGIITSINQKTGVSTAVPANADVRRILTEYGEFPKVYHEYTINRIIKELAEEAGIIEREVFIETVGGIKIERSIPRCKLVTCHTCRRSFITNKLKLKIPVNVVAKFAGSTIKNVEHYNKETVAEVALRYVGKDSF
jgi:integrase